MNLRDVGGLPAAGGRIRRGRLYRGGAPRALSPEAAAWIASSPIDTVFDLRTGQERDRLPSAFARPGVHEVSVPLLEGSLQANLADLPRLPDLYRTMLDHDHAAFARVARGVARAAGKTITTHADAAAREPDMNDTLDRVGHPTDARESTGAVLVHCTAGKDRTGVTIALLLLAVGVPADAVVADYALTTRELAGPWLDETLQRVRSAGGTITDELLVLIAEAPPAALEAALDHLDTRFGGAADYLARAGLTDAELELLHDRLVDG